MNADEFEPRHDSIRVVQAARSDDGSRSSPVRRPPPRR